MSGDSVQFRDALAAAVSRQVGAVEDESALPRDLAVQLTAERLVREALAKGHLGDADISDMQGFKSGNSAMMVARIHTRMSYVVKVDTSPTLVHEAYNLDRFRHHPALPEATRSAFPQVYAIDDVGPYYGYLMEDLDEYESLDKVMRRDSRQAAALYVEAWNAVLRPAYAASRRIRLSHDLWDDYFGRAADRLDKASGHGVLPLPDQPIEVECGSMTIAFRDGWRRELEHAAALLDEVQPGFGTWVHGDPNPENILWANVSGQKRFRLLDPKDWATGDYLFDIAKMTHYAVFTSPAEAGELPDPRAGRSGAITIDSGVLAAGRAIESELLDHVAQFAQEVGDQNWQTRYQLAVAANLLSIAGPRAVRGEQTDDATQTMLGIGALGLGLHTLRSVAAAF